MSENIVPQSQWRSQPTALSYSAASNFKQCKAKWHRRSIQGLPDPPGPPADIGTIVHSILEESLKDPPEDRTIERARHHAASIWAAYWAENPERAPLIKDVPAAKTEVWGHVVRFFEGTPSPAELNVLATEHHIDADIGGFPFRGIVDLVIQDGDDIKVVDFKTGRPPKPRFRGTFIDQLNLYSEALRSQGRTVSSAEAWFLKDGSVVQALAGTNSAKQTVREHKDVWDQIQSCAEQIDLQGPNSTYDIYPPNPGPLCGWCPYANDCDQGMSWLKEKGRDVMVGQIDREEFVASLPQ